MAFLGVGVIAYYRRKLPDSFIWIALYLLTFLILDVIVNVTAKMGIPNLPMVHIYAYLEFIFLSFFFRGIIMQPAFLVRNFNYLIILVSILLVSNSLFLQPFNEYNSYAKTLSNLSIILYSLVFIYNLFTGSIAKKFRPAFSTINSGILIYFMGTLVVYLLSNYIFINKAEIMNDIWKITIYLNIFLMFMIFLGTIQAIKTIRQTSV